MKGKDIDTKLDELTRIVEQGFRETNDLKQMVEKGLHETDELAQMVANGFRELQEQMATKEDLTELREDMASKQDLIRLRGDMDIMLDRHIGTFRKDYDSLAERVRALGDLARAG